MLNIVEKYTVDTAVESEDGVVAIEYVVVAAATVAALASQGIAAELEVVAGEDHVIALDPRDLLDWIDQALGR